MFATCIEMALVCFPSMSLVNSEYVWIVCTLLALIELSSGQQRLVTSLLGDVTSIFMDWVHTLHFCNSQKKTYYHLQNQPVTFIQKDCPMPIMLIVGLYGFMEIYEAHETIECQT